MTLPPAKPAKEKKHLCFNTLRHSLTKHFLVIPDQRQQNKISHCLHDALMSGFACMYFQDPSLLQFQARLHDERQSNNLKTLFGVQTIPKETQMRELIDNTDSEYLSPIYDDYFSKLQRAKYLEGFQVFPGMYLCSIDATQYFQSDKINCAQCLTKSHHKKTNYAHQALQPAIMHPSSSQVIPLMPEEICNGDGQTKQDCEINAAKRLLPKLRKSHPHLGLIINGDGLYSHQPFIEDILRHRMHYIFVAKPSDHTYMMEWLNTYETLHSFQVRDEKGRLHSYEWMNEVPLNGREDAAIVNFFRYKLICKDKTGREKITYQCSWVTDFLITKKNVKTLVGAARCRWKSENECFNTLKNQGYFLEHNYGHGQKNLCFNFYVLTVIAFFFHQIFEMSDSAYQMCRKKFGSKRHLWETLRAYIKIIIFQSWQHLLDFALTPTKYIPEYVGQPP